MDLPSLIRFGSWFVPIPFMLLYHVKTKKLDFLFPVVCSNVIFLFILPEFLGSKLGYRSELFRFYTLVLFFSFLLFYSKYELPQALGIAFCLTFFASLYWEIPYHIYTIILRGYLDQAFPLHLLYAFPGVFIWQKIKLKKDKLNFSLVIFSMLASATIMFFLLSLGADIFWTYVNPPKLRFVTESLWMVNRIVCFSILYWVFYRGTPRVRICSVPVKENTTGET